MAPESSSVSGYFGGSASAAQAYPMYDHTIPKMTIIKYIQRPQSYKIKFQVLVQTSLSGDYPPVSFNSSFFPLKRHITYKQIKKFDKSKNPITNKNISKGFSQSLLMFIRATIQQAKKGTTIIIPLKNVH